MAAFVDVEQYFEHVYLVDLSPSLCEVARQRFARLGWKNVSVFCQDAREFRVPGQDAKADLITMSYSLSMIPGKTLCYFSAQADEGHANPTFQQTTTRLLTLCPPC